MRQLKLSWAQIVEIRETYCKGKITMAKLAEQYGVNLSYICAILAKRSRKTE